MIKYDLEILSVNYRSSVYLNSNIKYLSRYNLLPNKFRWTVVDNSEKREKLDRRFNVMAGCQKDGHNPSEHLVINGGSIYHGKALNLALKQCSFSSKFLLILDPDFYLIRPLSSILEEMSKDNLAFHGGSYSNKRKNLIRDFPVAFCLFIDLTQVPITDLDFHAGFRSVEEKIENGVYQDNELNPAMLFPDCGWRIYKKYKGGPLNYRYIRHKHNHKWPNYEHFPGFAMHLHCKVEQKPEFILKQHKFFIKELLRLGPEVV